MSGKELPQRDRNLLIAMGGFDMGDKYWADSDSQALDESNFEITEVKIHVLPSHCSG